MNNKYTHKNSTHYPYQIKPNESQPQNEQKIISQKKKKKIPNHPIFFPTTAGYFQRSTSKKIYINSLLLFSLSHRNSNKSIKEKKIKN